MSNRIVDEMNPDAYLHSKDIHTLLCIEENEPRGNIDKESGKSKEVEPDAFLDIDPVLAKVLMLTKEETTAQPFAHESLLIDRTEKKLSKAEKRMAERSYKIERGARISYKRTSYANYYPQSSTSQSALSNPVSTEKFNGIPSSFSHVPSMNLNLKRNSYASYYNNQEHSSPDRSTSLKSTNNKLSQLYKRPQNIDDSPASSHPAWPVYGATSNTSFDNGLREQPSLPTQQKLESNCANINNHGDQMQQRNMSVQSTKQQNTTPFPFKELAKQGVNIKEIVIRNDMAIPTNSNTEGSGSTIPLKAGDKVMLIQTPKGIYLRMGEKIIKIKLPASLLSSLESPSNDLEDLIPQMAVNKPSTNREQKENDNPTKEPKSLERDGRTTASKSHELVNLLSSDDDEKAKQK